MPSNDGVQLSNPELEMLRLNKESGYNYRQRRQDDWLENYSLYRDKVTVNRLIQRQSVNLPLMKQTIRTLLKDVDDMPVMFFENLDNDKDKEVFQNLYWKWTLEDNKAELKDIVDKRQVFLFGRSFDQWQIIDGKVVFNIVDPEDMLVSRYMDPVDIDTSRYLIHTHIFTPLSALANNKDYDQSAVKRMQKFYASELGIIKAADNAQMLTDKNRKLEALGVPDVDSPVLGETYVELSLHFVYKERDAMGDERIYLYVECDDMEILMKKPLEEIIGTTKDHYWRTHFPYNTWADDVDKQDFWTDGVADIVRPSNKILNVWYSQLVENRTLRSFGMHYYDSSMVADGFAPQTFNPVPWGWYPIPGKPSEVLQKVDIPDLTESLDEMNFIMNINERATGATATQQGVQTERSITLGEVQLALGAATERVKGLSKFYTPAWKARGEKFQKLVEAGKDKLDAVKLYTKGRNSDDIYTREGHPKDWMTESGYTTRVWSQDEKNTQDSTALEKLSAVKTFMPGNTKLDEIVNRKALEFANLGPDEINSVMEVEKKRLEQMAMMQNTMAAGAPGIAPGGPPNPMQPAPVGAGL